MPRVGLYISWNTMQQTEAEIAIGKAYMVSYTAENLRGLSEMIASRSAAIVDSGTEIAVKSSVFFTAAQKSLSVRTLM